MPVRLQWPLQVGGHVVGMAVSLLREHEDVHHKQVLYVLPGQSVSNTGECKTLSFLMSDPGRMKKLLKIKLSPINLWNSGIYIKMKSLFFWLKLLPLKKDHTNRWQKKEQARIVFFWVMTNNLGMISSGKDRHSLKEMRKKVLGRLAHWMKL